MGKYLRFLGILGDAPANSGLLPCLRGTGRAELVVLNKFDEDEVEVDLGLVSFIEGKTLGGCLSIEDDLLAAVLVALRGLGFFAGNFPANPPAEEDAADEADAAAPRCAPRPPAEAAAAFFCVAIISVLKFIVR